MNFTIYPTHITDVSAGDTVMHNGVMMTVCGKDIKRDAFMGTTIFGDSYYGGRRPVKVVKIIRALPGKN